MILNIEKYGDIAKEVLNKVPCIYIEQMQIIIEKNIKEEEILEHFKDDLRKSKQKLAKEILFGLQRMGYFFLSADGYCLSKGMYKKVVDERLERHILFDEMYRIEEIKNKIINFVNKDDLNAFWFIAGTFPYSKNFFIASKPWNYVFIKDKDEKSESLLYEIIYIPKEKEDIYEEVLSHLALPVSTQAKESIRRIAIIENEKSAFKVPRVGFSEIYLTSDKTRLHFKLLEEREKDKRWSDIEYE